MSIFKNRWLWLEIGIHVLFWAILIPAKETTVVVERMDGATQQFNTNAFRYWIYGVSALLFYGNIVVLAKYYYNAFYTRYALYLGVFVALTIGLAYLVLNQLFDDHFRFELLDAYLQHFIFLLFSVVYVLIRGQINSIRVQRLQKQEQLEHELAFLKSQINPHFLFNTINNIFSIAQKNKDEEVAQYLADLSKIMRYSLYESNDVRVPLNKEIKFLESYVKMCMLKFSEDDLKVHFNIAGSSENRNIAPLLLIALVENAFKHGPIPGKPSHINIDLNVNEEGLEFIVVNSYVERAFNENGEPCGIGLKNLKRRLDLLYPNQFQIENKDDGNIFEVGLKIPLNG